MGQDQGVTRRAAIGMGAAAAAATVLVANQAGAAQADSADATKATITLAEAQTLLDAAVAKATEINVPMYVLVVDESGKEKASVRMDGNALAALTLVPLKANTAISFRSPTHALGQSVAEDPVRLASLTTAGGFTLLGGGLPIRRGDAVIGAIGVGGGSPEQDITVGQAALDALGGG
jgi:glc operon protein GlcG